MQFHTRRYVGEIIQSWERKKLSLATGSCVSKGYSEPCQTSMMNLFAKIVNDWKLLNILANITTVVIWQGPEYVSTFSTPRGHDSRCLIFDARLLKALSEVGLSPTRKNCLFFFQCKPFKNDEKSFLFHLKSSFRSQNI